MNPIIELDYLAVLFGLLTVVCGWLSWRSAKGSPPVLRRTLTGLRILTVVCLGLIALNPGSWQKADSETAHGWAVLADNSRSMQTTDVNGKSRWTALTELYSRQIAPETKNANIAVYAFADGLGKELKDLSPALPPETGDTDIFKSGEELIARYRNSAMKLDGILLLSDGRQVAATGNEKFILAAKAENIPVYAVPFGGKVARRDLELVAGKRRYLAFAGQELDIPVTVRSSNLGNIICQAALTNRNGKVMERRKLSIPENKTISTIFKLKFDKPGYYQYEISLPEQKNEAIRWNNRSQIGVTVLRKKLNILFVEGQPFWDSKFFSQLLRNSKDINLTTIYRIAAGRYFSIKSGSSQVTEDRENMFPTTISELSRYDMIIFGKGIEYFLDEPKTRLLKKYVTDNGGAILFSRGKPYAGKLPFLAGIETVEWGNYVEGSFRWLPTATGVREGLFGSLLPGPDNQEWNKLPPIKRISAVRKLKTFTEVLMAAEENRQGRKIAVPSLITRRFGRGIVVTVNSEGIWQWDFFPAAKETSKFYKNFWMQIIHWIVMYAEYLPGADCSLRLSGTVVKPHSSVMAAISRRDTTKVKGDMKLLVHKDGKLYTEIVPVKETGSAAKWTAILSFDQPGSYLVELNYRDAAGKIRKLFEPVFVSYPTTEQDNLSADPALLARLTGAAAGKVLLANEVAGLFRNGGAEDDPESTVRKRWVPWWTNWSILCFTLLLFALECFLRRRNGLL